MKNNTPWNVFASCMLVRGSKRSVICDLQRNLFLLIPNALHDILTKYESMPIDTIKSQFAPEEGSTIDEYFEYLIENEIVFFTTTPQLFPKINLDWHNPATITNAIIDFQYTTEHWESFVQQVDELGCKHIQCRFTSEIDLETLNTMLEVLNYSNITSVEFVIKQSSWTNKENLYDLAQEYKRIFAFCVYSAENNEEHNMHMPMGKVFYIKDNLDSAAHCGKISPSSFYVNTPTFTEAQHHNSCLNRKISIDANGNIKNCPSMTQSFGNINNTNLQEALDHPEFKKYWNITKDHISVCKDCEFRYICTDCRAYTENPEDNYSKPLKCGYNPYTSKWEAWSTNPLKQMAIDHYGMRDELPEFKMKPDYVPTRRTTVLQ